MKPKRETLKNAGYTHICTLQKGEHLLQDADGKREVWFANKNHASYGLIYGNTHLEFARSYSVAEEVPRIVARCRAASVSSVYAATHHGMGFLLARNSNGIVFRDDAVSQSDREILADKVNVALSNR